MHLHVGQAIREELGVLVALMGEWAAMLDEGAHGDVMAEPKEQPAAALKLDLARIEGLGICHLCSNDVEATAHRRTPHHAAGSAV